MTSISEELLTQCMHCGLCLSVCPTYALTGLERSSPRGRIRLMKNVIDGTLPISPTFVDEMSFCLDCQACETACPAGVKYGELVESARVMIESKKRFSLKKILLKYFVTKRSVLLAVAYFLKFYQKSGMERLFLGFIKMVLPSLHGRMSLLPRISSRFALSVLPETTSPLTEPRGTVAVLTGCIMDVCFGEVNIDTVEVLSRNGWRVVIPHDQVCCGSLSAHNGDAETPRSLARRNIEAFETSGADHYVINSAGCGAFMKQYGEILRDDRVYSERAARFSGKVVDFSEFLFKTGYRKPATMIGKKTVYHEACHLVHAQKVSAEPKAITMEISGRDFCELPESTWCCGSAGIYNVVRYEDGSRLLARKMENIKSTGAEIVVTGNPGCISQIESGIRRENLQLEVVHPASLLNRLYKAGD